MITRKEYLSNSRELFHEYYGQFVTKGLINLVRDVFGTAKLIKAYQEDKNLNNIPLEEWDRIPVDCFINIDKYRESSGGHYALVDAVCIAKTAAKQIVFEERPDLRNYHKEN